MNLVVLEGRVTVPIEKSEVGGRTKARLAISVPGPGRPRRLDVIPITFPDPTPEILEIAPGSSVAVIGSIHRRFWAGPSGRQSRLDVVAARLEPAPPKAGDS